MEAPNTCTPVEESRPAPGAPAPAPLRISDDSSKSPSNYTEDTLAATSHGNTSFRPTWRLVVGLLLLMVVGGGEYLLM